MRSNRYIMISCALAALLLAVVGCRKTNSPSNAVFLADASNVKTTSLTVDSSGANMDVLARAADIVGNDVQVGYVISQENLEEYNDKNGTHYEIPPREYYSLSSESAEIKEGNAFSNQVVLEVKDLGKLPESKKYAIPVSISTVKGNIPLLESSKTIIVLLNRVIYTTVPHLKYSSIDVTYDKPFNNLNSWTMEWRANMDALYANNQALIYSYPSEVYARFGDVVIRPTQLQVKTAGVQFSPDQDFQPGIWYNFALVYNGSSLKWYVNGQPVLNVPLSTTYNFESIGFGNTTGSEMVNEIRFWTVARSQSEIKNNLYAIDPSSPGLVGYWKLNEGSGNVFKDATGNGNDMEASSSNITWVKNVRMPPK